MLLKLDWMTGTNEDDLELRERHAFPYEQLYEKATPGWTHPRQLISYWLRKSGRGLVTWLGLSLLIVRVEQTFLSPLTCPDLVYRKVLLLGSSPFSSGKITMAWNCRRLRNDFNITTGRLANPLA